MYCLRTFIVEDNALILENLSATLEELTPVQVVGSAGDEASAMQCIGQLLDLDLLIIDVFLSQGSGLGVLRRTMESGVPARRVVLTNYATAEMRARCYELGAHRVFDKSTDLDELLSYCMRLAAGRGDSAPCTLKATLNK